MNPNQVTKKETLAVPSILRKRVSFQLQMEQESCDKPAVANMQHPIGKTSDWLMKTVEHFAANETHGFSQAQAESKTDIKEHFHMVNLS